MAKKKFYLTTAIDYVNSPPHIGTAYEKIAADSIARFHRIMGEDVLFLMGTDEHSLNVQKQAQNLGLETVEYCDNMAREFEGTWKQLFISYDDFIRTTEPRHEETVKDFFRIMHERGDITQGVYEGPYCVSCEAFIKEGDLVDGLCPVHSLEPQWLKEENYFFNLSAYHDRLLKHIEAYPEFIQPEIRRNEIINMIKGGLENISISRSSVSWGISLPVDDSQVIYVWFDALINYVSGAGYWKEPGRLEKYWPADLHIIGKDITRFHCIIWPAMLMSVGLPLPKTVFGHGFVSMKGEKMSKTRGTVAYPLEIADTYGADALRYFLLREIPFDRDGDFSIAKLEHRYNADLANDLGNLLSRVMALAEKKLQGKVVCYAEAGEEALDKDVRETAERSLREMIVHMETYNIDGALKSVWSFVQRCNRYMEETAPWSLSKDPLMEKRLSDIIYNLIESLRWIGLMIFPFIPSTSGKLFDQLGLGADYIGKVILKDLSWSKECKQFHVRKKDALFPRLEKK